MRKASCRSISADAHMGLRRRNLLQLCGAVALTRALPGFAAPAVTAGQIAADTSRPQIHLVGPAHRINDPNGPVYHKGKYHIFYQKAERDGKHWGMR